FADVAGAPTFAVPVDRSLTGVLPTGLLPKALRPGTLVRNVLRSSPAQVALRETVGRLGLPPQAVEHLSFPTRYGARATERALAGSGLTVPELATYAEKLWT